MKILVRGSVGINPNHITDVAVSEGSGRPEVLIKHETEKTGKERVDSLSNPRNSFTKEQCDQFVENIKWICSNQDADLAEIIGMPLWMAGHASDNFPIDSPLTPIALADLCWGWAFGQIPSDKQIQVRTGLSGKQASDVAKSAAYLDRVRTLITKSYTAFEFVKWCNEYGSMNKRFGARMRIPEDITAQLIGSIADDLNVDIPQNSNKIKAEKQKYGIIWGCYDEPDSRKFDLYGQKEIEATSLVVAKQTATRALANWIRASLPEEDKENRKTMSEALDINQGKWFDGKNNSARTIGEKDGNWSGFFLKVALKGE